MANVSCDVAISVNRTEWKTPTDVILGLGAASLMISCLDIGAFFCHETAPQSNISFGDVPASKLSGT